MKLFPVAAAPGVFKHRISYLRCRSEFRVLRNKARKRTAEALEDIRTAFPVPLRGTGSDNGGELINWHLKDWCEKHRLTFTRGRRCRKNDNAYVEQKNGDIVRKTVGYARFRGDSALAALSAVYDVLKALMNFFYPNMKRVDKLQIGQKKKRIYEKELKTPLRRITERTDIPEDIKRALQKKKDSPDITASREALNRLLIILADWRIMLPAADRRKARGKILPWDSSPPSVRFLRDATRSRTGSNAKVADRR